MCWLERQNNSLDLGVSAILKEVCTTFKLERWFITELIEASYYTIIFNSFYNLLFPKLFQHNGCTPGQSTILHTLRHASNGSEAVESIMLIQLSIILFSNFDNSIMVTCFTYRSQHYS